MNYYKYYVCFYIEGSGHHEESGIVGGESYVDAMCYLTRTYGDKYIEELYISYECEDTFVMKENDKNVQMDKVFNKLVEDGVMTNEERTVKEIW